MVKPKQASAACWAVFQRPVEVLGQPRSGTAMISAASGFRRFITEMLTIGTSIVTERASTPPDQGVTDLVTAAAGLQAPQAGQFVAIGRVGRIASIAAISCRPGAAR